MTKHSIRPAVQADCARILELIRELAIYEKLLSEVVTQITDLEQWLFAPHPPAESLVAELDGQIVGFALFFTTFSTFKGKPGIYLEDLFVLKEYRGQGIGKALFMRVAQLTHERGYGRMEWSVLDWNQPSIDFYRSMGAVPLDDWTMFRLTEKQLVNFA
jgi:GNAT superfamily N-acetyltransferase